MKDQPLISVVITCYNQGNFLRKSIESVLTQQDYLNYEILVVDDGSTDNTKLIATSYPQVTYIYKENAGLAAARNTGIDHSDGVYLLFLDADDWLFPQALAINSKFLIGHDEIAFVSGNHEFYLEWDGTTTQFDAIEVMQDHYAKLLETNYISMHATVLYQHWVFNDLRYDSDLITHEDYDMHLRISRKYPVVHHQFLIAVYRIHNANMSRDAVAMFEGVMSVFRKQEPTLQSALELESYRKGVEKYKKYFEKRIFENLKRDLSLGSLKKNELAFLRKSNKLLYLKFEQLRNKRRLKQFIKSVAK